jgi:hypothetical protein
VGTMLSVTRCSGGSASTSTSAGTLTSTLRREHAASYACLELLLRRKCVKDLADHSGSTTTQDMSHMTTWYDDKSTATASKLPTRKVVQGTCTTLPPCCILDS